MDGSDLHKALLGLRNGNWAWNETTWPKKYQHGVLRLGYPSAGQADGGKQLISPPENGKSPVLCK